MQDMRDRASYDLSELKSHLRAAGEDITLNRQHEHRQVTIIGYNAAELEALLSAADWRELSLQVEIPAGRFTMGTNRARADEYDKPEHELELPAFYIDKYPVTNAQYARFVLATGHRPPLHWEDGKIPSGLELHPVTMVSWFDANRYAEWSGKRLPTEAEWEKAARGSDSRRWPWGNNMMPDKLNTYYSLGATSSVFQYTAGQSPYGVMDMAGNVSEWTNDDFLAYKNSQAEPEVFMGKIAVANSPQDQALKVVDLINVDENYKVLRGGSWKSDPFSTATYHRNYSWPHYASDFFGFRCVSDIEIKMDEI